MARAKYDLADRPLECPLFVAKVKATILSNRLLLSALSEADVGYR